MNTFHDWLGHLDLLDHLRLLETYFTFDANEYNALFEEELEGLLQRVSDPAHRQVLQQMRSFNWVGYIAASARNAGFRDYRARQEATADVVSKLLMGTLFRGYDERTSNFLLRFKASVGNALRNIVQKLRNRKRNLPTASTAEYEPAAPSSPVHDDGQMIEDFRKLLRSRLGGLAVALFDLRLSNGETKSLVNSLQVGSPSRFEIKKTVQAIKALLAQEYAQQRGDPIFLRDVSRAMERESETLQKRFGKAVVRTP